MGSAGLVPYILGSDTSQCQSLLRPSSPCRAPSSPCGDHPVPVETLQSHTTTLPTMKLTILLLAVTLSLTLSAPSPQCFSLGSRSDQGGQSVGRSQDVNNRLFTGNPAIDSAAAGAALGLATQYIGNQIFNPCRSGDRNTNRNNNNNPNP